MKNYLVNLENARSKVSLKDETMQELIKGTPYRPTLELLLEWAVEGFQYFHKMYSHPFKNSREIFSIYIIYRVLYALGIFVSAIA